VLLYYDWLLTFPKEVRYIWGARFSLSTVFYVFCRYALVANLLYLLEISNILGSSLSLTCNDWKKFVSALSVFGRAAIIATLISRTYAVYSRNLLILVYLIMLGIVCVVTDALHVPTEKCVNTIDPPLATLLRSVFTIIFETSVAIFTTIRTFQALRAGGPWKSQKRRLVYVVFEEGILYFCTISVLTIASLILDIHAPTGFLQRLLDGLTLPLSGALTARFILHLRSWRDKQSGVFIISTTHETELEQHKRDSPALVSKVDWEDPVARVQQQRPSPNIVVQVDFEDSGSDGDTFLGSDDASRRESHMETV